MPTEKRANILSQSYLLYYNDFRIYNPTEFSQYYESGGRNCSITFVANFLSYYKRLGFTNLFPGDTITQSFYNEIADSLDFTSAGNVPVYKVFDSIKYFAQKAGYKAYQDDYLLDLWSDVTRDIKLGYPVAAIDTDNEGHIYMAVGYIEYTDGTRKLYTITNLQSPNTALVDFDQFEQLRSYHITY